MEEALSSFRSLSIAGAPDNSLPLKNRSMLPVVCGFTEHKKIGKYAITRKEEYSDLDEDCIIPELVSSEKLDKLRGTYLGIGYEKATHIRDYNAYHELKQEFFFKWLIKSGYFEKVKEGVYKKPDVICFGGRITDPMQSPFVTRFGDWEMYGAKFNDAVFLWDKKTGSGHKRTKESSYGVTFEALLTGKDPVTVNEYEKSFVVQEVKLGNHQLLLVNEFDAVDEGGDLMEIKVYKPISPLGMKAKYLSYWAQSVVPGVNKLVLGRRNDDGVLLDIKKISLDQVRGLGSINPSSCYEFADRLLKWIGAHLKDNDAKLVKKFSWKGPPSANILCGQEKPGASIIPEWFCDAIKN